MANCKVTVKGTGQLNGPVPINKSVEMDQQASKAFTGSNRDQAIVSFVNTHFPGVEVNPKNFSVNVTPIKSTSEKRKSTSKKYNNGGSLVAGAIGGAIWNELKGNNENVENEENTQDFSLALNHLTQMSFYGGNITETIEKLDRISLQTTGFKWEFSPNSEKGKQNNRILNQCLKQYQNGLQYLHSITDDKEILDNYVKQLAALKLKRFINLSWMILLVIAIFVALYIATLF